MEKARLDQNKVKRFMSNYLSGKYYLAGYLTPVNQKRAMNNFLAIQQKQIILLERS